MNGRILSRACGALGIVIALILTLGTPVAAQEETQTPSSKFHLNRPKLFIKATRAHVSRALVFSPR